MEKLEKTEQTEKNQVSPETTQREDSKLQTEDKEKATIRRQAVPAQLGETSNRLSKINHETPNKNEKQVIQQMAIRRLLALALVVV
jgi:hypothetical protein